MLLTGYNTSSLLVLQYPVMHRRVTPQIRLVLMHNLAESPFRHLGALPIMTRFCLQWSVNPSMVHLHRKH